ncbi:MAG: alpha/beta fold hydrolase [Gemmatimonadetes bacterium]|nr:alpha/beta fold hydrolase [Gemmatimonadota bacterium]
MKKRWILLPLFLLPLLACGSDATSPEGETVVLVHGLGRAPASMAVMAQRLKWAGYHVAVVSYDSRTTSLHEQAAEVAAVVAGCCVEANKVHFVGHSLGGLVIRRYLADHRLPSLGRVVLVTPPNQGSMFVDWLSEVPLAAEVLGPVGSALGTDSTDIPARLPPPDYDVGIIAGNRAVHPIGPVVIRGPDDGIVSIEQTRIGDVPMIILPRSHAFIMNSRHAADATIRFLRTGSFEEGAG